MWKKQDVRRMSLTGTHYRPQWKAWSRRDLCVRRTESGSERAEPERIHQVNNWPDRPDEWTWNEVENEKNTLRTYGNGRQTRMNGEEGRIKQIFQKFEIDKDSKTKNPKRKEVSSWDQHANWLRNQYGVESGMLQWTSCKMKACQSRPIEFKWIEN